MGRRRRSRRSSRRSSSSGTSASSCSTSFGPGSAPCKHPPQHQGPPRSGSSKGIVIPDSALAAWALSRGLERGRRRGSASGRYVNRCCRLRRARLPPWWPPPSASACLENRGKSANGHAQGGAENRGKNANAHAQNGGGRRPKNGNNRGENRGENRGGDGGSSRERRGEEENKNRNKRAEEEKEEERLKKKEKKKKKKKKSKSKADNRPEKEEAERGTGKAAEAERIGGEEEQKEERREAASSEGGSLGGPVAVRLSMGNARSGGDPSEEMQRGVLGLKCSARQVVEKLRDGKYASVVVMAGAGISVSCGIPDFRTPGTGLYDNLQRFNLPTPESVFELDFFQENNGEAFYKLAKEMWPDKFRPSPTHLFVRLLHDKGLLRRAFTQNIDTLERIAGVPDDKLVEAHGSFAKSSCTVCRHPFDSEDCKLAILEGNTPIRCRQPNCGGLVKPDIVFFGEGLPPKFGICSAQDLPQADLLIVMGTSLTVHPFAGLTEMVSPDCPRLLLNMQPVGVRIPSDESNGLRLNQPENWRDVMIQGPCDDAVRAICDILGWREDLENLVEEFGSNGGPDRTPVDIQKAFPKMGPEGLDKDWRLPVEKTRELPRIPRAPKFYSEDFDLPLLEEAARAAHRGMELFVFEEYTSLRTSGQIAGMLCLTDESLRVWNGCHVLALVEAGANHWDMEIISNCELLDEPMTRPGPDGKRAAFHQVAFQIPPGNQTKYELWYVDTTHGRVPVRWGPFELNKSRFSRAVTHSEDDDDLVADDDDDDQSDQSDQNDLRIENLPSSMRSASASAEDIDQTVDEIVHAMGDLPAHLEDKDDQDQSSQNDKRQ